MRQAQPHWKSSHACWYVNVNGVQHRLDPDKKKAWELYHKLMAGSRVVGADDPVIRIVTQFMDWSEANHTTDTYRFYRVYNQSFLRSLPRNLKLRDLKPFHVTRWIDKHWPVQDIHDRNGKLVTMKASNNTRHGAIRAVTRPLNWARKQGLIEANPLANVEKPKPTPRDAYLWPKQYESVLKLVVDEPFRDVMQTLRHTGCRPKEVRIMEARWFDRENRCWEFPREESKGGQKRRVVLLNDVAFEITDRLARKNLEGPLFLNTRRQPWRKQSLIDRCARLRVKVGFYVTMYAIRHTFATDAIIRGVDLVTVAQLMGHSDLRMLSEIYQHVEKRSDHLRKGLEQATGHLTGQNGNGNGTDDPPSG